MRVLALLGVLLAFAVAGSASAQDSDLRLYGEPTSYTDVIDAFDDGDPFDVNLSLSFRSSSSSGTVQRENNPSSPIATGGRAAPNYIDIANYTHSRNTLTLGLDMGIHHDLAVFARLPVVLGDQRSLSALSDVGAAGLANAALQTVTDPAAPSVTAPLFDTNFESPSRSGLEYVAVGFAWSILNQYREGDHATWLVMTEGRFALAEPMHACDSNDAARYDTTNRCNGSEDPGLSEGTNALRLETRASWRGRYIEPYAGLWFQIDWPGSAQRIFSPGGDLSGFMNTLPPRRGEFTAGIAVIPWEQRARSQRFTIDLRVTGMYISEGHGYSPLFDALGARGAPNQTRYLTEPNWEAVDPMTMRGTGRQVPFTGLTDMEAHGRFGAEFALEMQAARYVRFRVGAGLAWETPYAMTFADACNPNVSPAAGDPRIGNCKQGSIINPHQRAVIDLPGNRFIMGTQLLTSFELTAIGQF